MQSFFYFFVLSLLVISCENNPDTGNVEGYFNQTSFDNDVVKNLPYYDSIKNIAVADLDTIFRFSNSRHIVDVSDGKGNIKKRQVDQPSYSFSYDFTRHMFLDYMGHQSLPDTIVHRLSTYFDKLGKQNIGGFTLDNDRTVKIAIKGIRDEKSNAEGGHFLIWQSKYERNSYPQLHIKDTVIAPGWTYQIYMEQKLNGGWPR